MAGTEEAYFRKSVRVSLNDARNNVVRDHEDTYMTDPTDSWSIWFSMATKQDLSITLFGECFEHFHSFILLGSVFGQSFFTLGLSRT